MSKAVYVLLCKIMLLSVLWVGNAAIAVVGDYGDIAVQIAPTISSGGESTMGYVDYQATLTNIGPVERRVELIMPGHASQNYGYYIRQMSRTVVVPPGSTAMVSLFQPPLRLSGDGVRVVIDGRHQREILPLTTVTHFQLWGSGGDGCLLLSRQIGFDAVNQSLQADSGYASSMGMMYPSGSSPGFALALSEFPVSQWSQQWLSYSRYNGVLMTGQEWATLPAGVRRALLEYVRCGGTLLLIGPGAAGDGAFDFERTQGIFQIADSGFGAVFATSRTDVGGWTTMDWNPLRDSWRASSSSARQFGGIHGANDWFPVIEDLSIPVRGLLLVVLLFAVLIGPANLFILSRKRRQIWLFWTVPLLSLLASVSVFGYAAFAEGWTGFARIASLTILDESETLASTLAITGFYCPLNPREGLHFDYETECTPQVDRDTYGTGSPRTVDWTRGQHLASGWVTARVPAHFLLRKSQMRREKIVFSPADAGAYEALNGFGVSLAALYYADADGQVYVAEEVPAGARHAMRRFERTTESAGQAQTFRSLRQMYNGDWYGAITVVLKDPTAYLEPNTYIAIIHEPLFIEQGLRQKRTETIESVVFGILPESF